MVFIDSLVFITNISGHNNSKILVFKQNDMFEQPQFSNAGAFTLKLYLVRYLLVFINSSALIVEKFRNLIFEAK